MIVIAQLVAGTAWAAPAPVRLHVTGERLEPKQAKALEPSVREAVEGLLREEYGVAIEDDATTELKIELRPLGDKKKRDELIFRVTVSTDGDEVYAGQPTSCLHCDETKLLASVRTRVTEVVEHLPEQPEPAVAEGPVPEDEPEAEEDPGSAINGEGETAEPGAKDGSLPAAPSLIMRNVGLGLLVPGCVSLGVGIGFVAVGTREVYPTDEEEIGERDYRPPGTVIAIMGGVVTGAGVGLLVAHAIRGRKGNDSGGERLTLRPVLDGTHAGAVLRGRF